MKPALSISVAAVVLTVPFALHAAIAHAASLFDGTWKSTVESTTLPKQPDIFKLKDGVFTCVTCVPSYTVPADGMDHPVTGQVYFDSAAVTVVDDRTVKETDKKSGKVVQVATSTVAPDGKTITYDMSNMAMATPITAKGTATRVAPGAAGSHAIAGAWRMTALTGLSDNVLSETISVADGNVTLTNPLGISYTAPLSGKDAPYKGDPGVTDVSVKMKGSHTLVETDKRDGKVVVVLTRTVGKDGDTMAYSSRDMLMKRTIGFSATKQ